MRCTRCLNVHLEPEEISGQLYETCPRCRGVWLSRQEFDEILAQRSTAVRAPETFRDQPRDRDRDRDRERDRDRDRAYDNDRYSRHHDSSGRLPSQRGRKSLLGQISDLFD
jgi:uncharacterized protein